MPREQRAATLNPLKEQASDLASDEDEVNLQKLFGHLQTREIDLTSSDIDQSYIDFVGAISAHLRAIAPPAVLVDSSNYH
ncbi:hypothetical protein ACM66B_004235 [Microbotryomycetes sp. NB124-2]